MTKGRLSYSLSLLALSFFDFSLLEELLSDLLSDLLSAFSSLDFELPEPRLAPDGERLSVA